MGTDTPLAVLSDRPQLLYDYFKQNFAQVTNPPIDPIREALVMSLVSMIGPRPNLLGHQAGTHKRLEVSQPILTNEDLEKIRSIHETLDGAFRTIDARRDLAGRAATRRRSRRRSQRLCWEATEAVLADINVLILSDRGDLEGPAADPGRAGHRRGPPSSDPPGPADADRPRRRDRRGARGPPFLRARRLWRRGGQSLARLRHDRGAEPDASTDEAQANYIKAVGKGMLKVMSKMGISTYQSYCGAQIFDAIGLSPAAGRRIFHRHRDDDRGHRPRRARRGDARGGTASPIGKAPTRSISAALYAQRIGGEAHAWTHDSVANLQHAVRGNLPDKYRAFAEELNEQSRRC